MQKIKAFLHVSVSLEGLSAPYKQAIEAYRSLEPEILCLPWPETAIPPVNSKITSSYLPSGFDELTVVSHEYRLYEKGDIRVEVETQPRQFGPNIPTDNVLKYFAEAGFVFFGSWDKPIKDILVSAGLLESK